MRNTLKQAIVLWGMVLLLVLWSVFISPSGVLRWAAAAAIVLAVAALLIYRRWQAWTEMTGDAGLSSLPPETYRQPVVLVCGGLSAHLFTDSPVRQVSEGLYLHVPDEEQLVAQVERLLTLRPAWASQLAVAYTVMPGIHRDVAVLAGQLRRFAHSMATVRRRAGVNVPWLLWSGLSGSPLPKRASSPWFICTGGEVQVATSAETTMPAQWIAQSGVQERSQRLCYLLKAESLMQWLDLNMLAELNGPEAKCPPLAMAVGLHPSLPAVDNNLWQLWITARTGLTPDIADTGTDDTLPFPDALLRRLPRQSGFTPLRRACVTMLGITTVAGIAALCLSATANRQLLRQVGDDLHQFYAVPAEEFITKARHLSVLKDDAVMLDGYYREGEPLRLGLGLYPGERIRQPVLRAIRDWRPPEQKMEVTASLQVQTVRLDSMSLFDVGQARLKDGSTKVLVDALVNIRAKPGWLILVAGYTDATGDEKSNQQLSLRRAEAVRKRPYSVVLLDEVEKAHRDVMNLFYQVFDRGFMRDGEGREIDFRNTVILMTANLGSDHIMQLLEEKPDATDADLHELLYPLLRDHFQPALMARFQTVIYRPLGQEAMRAIVEMKLAQVARRLHQHYGLETEISNSLYDALTAACLLPDTGARNIDSLLNQQILPVLSQQLLAQQAVHHKPARLRLDWDDEDGIVLEFDEK